MYLQTQSGRGWVKSIIQSSLKDSINGDLRFDIESGSILGTANLRNVQLWNSEGKFVASAKSIDAFYNPLGFLWDDLRVYSIDVEGLIFVVQSSEQKSNLKDLFISSEEPSSSKLVVSLEKIRIKNSAFISYSSPIAGRIKKHIQEGKALKYSVLRELSKSAQGPKIDENKGPVGPVVLSNLDSELKVTITNGSTLILLDHLKSKIAIDTILKEEQLDFPATKIVFAKGGMTLDTTKFSIGKKVHIGKIHFRGDFPIEDKDNWFSDHELRIEDADLSRGYLYLLSNFAINPKRNLKTSLTTSGAMPNNLKLDVSVLVDKSELHVKGELKNALNAKPIFIDLNANTPTLKIGDIIPIDGKYLFNGDLKVKGNIGDDLKLSIQSKLNDFDILDYHMTSAEFDVDITKSDYQIHKAEILWEKILAKVRGKISKKGDVDINFQSESKHASKKLQVKADVNADIKAKIKWDAEEVDAFVEMLNMKGDWDLDNLKSPHFEASRSSGDFHLKVPIRPEEAIRIKVKGKGKSLRFKRDSLHNFLVNVDVKSKTRRFNIESLLAKLRGNVSLRLAKAKLGQTRLSHLNVKAKIDAITHRNFNYEIEGSLKELRQKDLNIKNAVLDGKGKFATNSKNELIKLSAKGNLKAASLRKGVQEVNTLNAEFDLSGPPHDLRGDVDFTTTKIDASPYFFESSEGEIRLRKNNIFQVDLKGVQSRDRIPKHLDVALSGSYKNGIALDKIDIGKDSYQLRNSISLKNGNINFDDVSIKKGNQKLSITGKIRNNKDQNLDIAIENFEIQDLSKDLGLNLLDKYRARIDADIHVEGDAQNPSSTFSIHFREVFIGDIGPIKGHFSGHYRNKLMVVEKMEIDFFNELTLKGHLRFPIALTQNGTTTWYFDKAFQSSIHIAPFDPGKLLTRFTKNSLLNLSGMLSSTINVAGTLDDPTLDMNWTLEKLLVDGGLKGVPLHLGPFSGNIDTQLGNPMDKRFQTKATLESEIGKLDFNLSSRENLSKIIRELIEDGISPKLDLLDFDASVRTYGLEINKLQIGPLVDAKAEGGLDLAIDFAGSLSAPDIGAKITLVDFGWDRFRDINFYTAFHLDERYMKLIGTRLAWDGSQILTGSAEVPNPLSLTDKKAKLDEIPLSISVDLTPFKLSKLSAFDYQFASLAGILGGKLRASGSFRELRLQSTISVSKLILGDGVEADTKVQIALNQHHLNVQLDLKRSNENVDLNVSIPFVQNMTQALADGKWIEKGKIEGGFHAAKLPLAGLLPRALYEKYIGQLSGSLDASIDLSGTTQKPLLDGMFNITDSAFTLLKYGRRFENLQLGMEFEKEKVRFNKFHLRDGSGYLEGKGFATFKNWSPKTVGGKFKAKRFSIAGFSSVPAFISTDVELAGNISKTSSTSTLKISNLTIALPEDQTAGALPTDLDEDILIIENEEDELKDLFKTKRKVADSIYARMKVIINDGEVVHPVGNVHFDGDLDLELANIGPLIHGDIRTLKGKVETFGKIFSVKPGLVSFRGLDPPDPLLQLEAHYKLGKNITNVVGQASTGEPRAIVRINGSVSDFKTQFSSDPLMSEPDVIYVLITDQPPGSAGVGQAEAGLALGAASTGLTGIASMIVGSANKVLPDIAKVDVVRVETGETEGKLEVGKYLSRKLFVLYRYRFGAEEGESQHEVNFEYRFVPSWILEFQVGDAAQGEINLLWDIF